MLTKLITFLLIIVCILGIGYYITCVFMVLDEENILKNTRNAYKTTQFKNEPFLKKQEFQNLTDFLFRHIDAFRSFNHHEESKSIQLSDGGGTNYSNSGECFNLPTFHESFIKAYIPSELIDSLYHYTEGLRNELISGFSLCSEGFEDNVDSNKPSVSFTLMNSKEEAFNPNYYLHQSITQNRKFELSDTLNSIYDYGLSKDTVLFQNLRYSIIIVPYSGF